MSTDAPIRVIEDVSAARAAVATEAGPPPGGRWPREAGGAPAAAGSRRRRTRLFLLRGVPYGRQPTRPLSVSRYQISFNRANSRTNTPSIRGRRVGPRPNPWRQGGGPS